MRSNTICFWNYLLSWDYTTAVSRTGVITGTCLPLCFLLCCFSSFLHITVNVCRKSVVWTFLYHILHCITIPWVTTCRQACSARTVVQLMLNVLETVCNYLSGINYQSCSCISAGLLYNAGKFTMTDTSLLSGGSCFVILQKQLSIKIQIKLSHLALTVFCLLFVSEFQKMSEGKSEPNLLVTY